jgi:hypothetical protein
MWFLSDFLLPLLVAVITATYVAKKEFKKSRKIAAADRALNGLNEIQAMAIAYWSKSGLIDELQTNLVCKITVFRREVGKIDDEPDALILPKLAANLNKTITGGDFATAQRLPDDAVIEKLNNECLALSYAIERCL